MNPLIGWLAGLVVLFWGFMQYRGSMANRR
jgi:hypothetical protein